MPILYYFLVFSLYFFSPSSTKYYITEASNCASIFLVEPGEGEEVVYGPAGHNTSLTCSVKSNTLVWDIDNLRFGGFIADLHERGIFQSQLMRSSNNISSTLSVFSSDTNQEANICCLSKISDSVEMCCTTLFVYYPPVQPVLNMPLYQRRNGSVKLSWIANLTQGIDHNYTIIIRNVIASTLDIVVYKTVMVPYYLFDICGEFDIEVKAVNIAGESEPSATVRVSLPLLPDVRPVSDSLEHGVWKSSGQIIVQIHFEPAYFCARQAIVKYCVWLSSTLPKGNNLSSCVHSNNTEILLGLDDGVEDDNLYEYTITAVNDIGNSTSVTKNLSTFDVERVNLEKRLSHSIDIDCHFINGSDARGCKVVLLSDHMSVDNITTVLIRSNVSDATASGHVNLTYHINCYHYVLAFDIEANGTVSSSLAIRQRIEDDTTSECPFISADKPSLIAIIVPIIVVIIILIIISALILFLLVFYWKKRTFSFSESDTSLTFKLSIRFRSFTKPKCEPNPRQPHTYNLQLPPPAPKYPAPTPEHPQTLEVSKLAYDLPEKFSRKSSRTSEQGDSKMTNLSKVERMNCEQSLKSIDFKSQEDLPNLNERPIYYVLKNANDPVDDNTNSADSKSESDRNQKVSAKKLSEQIFKVHQHKDEVPCTKTSGKQEIEIYHVLEDPNESPHRSSTSERNSAKMSKSATKNK